MCRQNQSSLIVTDAAIKFLQKTLYQHDIYLIYRILLFGGTEAKYEKETIRHFCMYAVDYNCYSRSRDYCE